MKLIQNALCRVGTIRRTKRGVTKLINLKKKNICHSRIVSKEINLLDCNTYFINKGGCDLRSGDLESTLKNGGNIKECSFGQSLDDVDIRDFL